MNLSELKEKLTDVCNAYYDAKPYRSKSTHKILTILAEGGVDLGTLKSDIATAKTDSTKVKTEIGALVNTELFDDFQTGPDASMVSHVDGKMPSLINDRQRLDVAIMIQRLMR